MKRFLVERSIIGVGSRTLAQFRTAAARSNAALSRMGSGIQWVQSFIAGDKTYCIYLAETAAQVRQHADLSGIPATKISEIVLVVDPTTAGSTGGD